MVQPLAIDSLASKVLLSSLLKVYPITSRTFGILDPPPILSTEWSSYRFTLLSYKH